MTLKEKDKTEERKMTRERRRKWKDRGRMTGERII
jgi:hypothetical protein